ncbi:hypothetical protein [Pseudaestuariivita atlantica]|uniref:Uncharacterized protein n=1 Tax=Pseudaestuariivita atlantica TaxID=1317121 RepID=A0A0L1JSB1_9RHOB|nr:hypothetical protein [Pseudaestuariivita atlantica]KNG94674.1 hypothetical protein ATO11_04545 [Pseudaestuariivita atlantica]
MSFIRPEAAAALSRWAEALAGVALLALALGWLILGRGILPYVGAALAPLALAVIWLGVQRGRFRVGDGGPGTVQVAEGEIAYFGPLTGGVRRLRGLRAVILDPTAHPPSWVLQAAGEDDLSIPLDADGAEALFDAFAVLPGLKTGHMLRALETRPDHPVVIWHEPPARLH